MSQFLSFWFHEARFQPLSCKNFLTKIVFIVLHFVKKSSWALRCPSLATCCFMMNPFPFLGKIKRRSQPSKKFEEFLCILSAQEFAPGVSCFGNGYSSRSYHLTTCACGWLQICYQNQSTYVNVRHGAMAYFVSDLHLVLCCQFHCNMLSLFFISTSFNMRILSYRFRKLRFKKFQKDEMTKTTSNSQKNSFFNCFIRILLALTGPLKLHLVVGWVRAGQTAISFAFELNQTSGINASFLENKFLTRNNVGIWRDPFSRQVCFPTHGHACETVCRGDAGSSSERSQIAFLRESRKEFFL